MAAKYYLIHKSEQEYLKQSLGRVPVERNGETAWEFGGMPPKIQRRGPFDSYTDAMQEKKDDEVIISEGY